MSDVSQGPAVGVIAGEQQGFAAIAEIRIGGCPPIVPMLRRPNGQRIGKTSLRL